MEAPGHSSDSSPNSSSSSSPNSTPGSTFRFTASNFFRSPMSSFLEYSGVLHNYPHYNSINAPTPRLDESVTISGVSPPLSNASSSSSSSNNGEVSIRIISAGEQEENQTLQTASPSPITHHVASATAPIAIDQELDHSISGTASVASLPSAALNVRFLLTIWVAAFMFKSNDILRRQTALKGERRYSTLFGISFVFVLHVTIIYWWYWTDLWSALVMIPPKATPPFWHAIFIIMVNDTLIRQAAMVIKCIILMHYKNSKGRKYRKQGQLLTLIEYFVLLYRALVPAPVWYRFFSNKEYGSLFSSIIAGLYLTFKLISIVEKVQYLFASLRALSRTEIQYGTYATSEQVSEAGDLCAICQEKMHAPILLRCKHIFCEDCVSEWFERERTCPLCRALVKPAELRSFADGSTSLFFQLS